MYFIQCTRFKQLILALFLIRFAFIRSTDYVCILALPMTARQTAQDYAKSTPIKPNLND